MEGWNKLTQWFIFYQCTVHSCYQCHSQLLSVLNDKALLKQKKFLCRANLNDEIAIQSQLSSFANFKHIIASCFSFVPNSCLPLSVENFNFHTNVEIKYTLNFIIKQVKISAFPADIQCFTLNKWSETVNLSALLQSLM